MPIAIKAHFHPFKINQKIDVIINTQNKAVIYKGKITIFCYLLTLVISKIYFKDQTFLKLWKYLKTLIQKKIKNL